MKRTRFINLQRMRKWAGPRFSLHPLTVGVAVALTGCAQEEEVNVVLSVSECVRDTSLTEAQCQAAYEQAKQEAEQTAPRYGNANDCEYEFDQCYQTNGGFWVPFMTGWIVSEAIDEIGDAAERRRRNHPVFLYSGRSSSLNNRLMTSDGHVIGRPYQNSYRVSRSALDPKPATTRTVSRGGFGSTASAKSSWGGGSSSRSWGG